MGKDTHLGNNKEMQGGDYNGYHCSGYFCGIGEDGW